MVSYYDVHSPPCDRALCDKICQGLATGWWFSPGTPVSSTNKTDHHDITEILLKVALNTVTLALLRYNLFDLLNLLLCHFKRLQPPPRGCAGVE